MLNEQKEQLAALDKFEEERGPAVSQIVKDLKSGRYDLTLEDLNNFKMAIDLNKLTSTETAKNPKGITAGSPIYVGTKAIRAVPMNRADYNTFRGWDLPKDEDGKDEGYLVEYLDDGKPNVDSISGYVSWSPKEVFDKHYTPVIL